MKKLIKEAVVKTVPVMAGYVFLGSAFGILVQSHDLSIWTALFMSLIIYSGAMQFAAIPLLLNPIGLIQTFILTISINARHIFYGISMLKPFENAGKKKAYMIFSLTDESYSLLLNNKEDKNLMVLIEVLNQSYWVLGTLIGYLFGHLIPFSIEGIDFAMTALFLVIFMDSFFAKKYEPLALGLAVCGLSLFIFGPHYFIIPSMVGIILGLYLRGGKETCT
ncbi:MAG: branched-chain amino acid ABC transporter permease [Erysipelothrix sp.]|nr:branched-chain amino acid ABC transporter permease [Erysipelothrix sp.]